MTKFETRSTKYETNPNFLNSNVLNIRISNFAYFVSNLGFRISNLKLILLILTSIFIPKPIFAQSLSLSIYPPLLEVTIQPGRSVTQVYRLTNNSDHDLQISPVVFPFSSKGQNGEISINSKIKPQNFFSFTTKDQFNQPFLLPIGKTKELLLRIAIPKNTPENDYYHTLLFSTSIQNEDEQNTNTSSITQIGSNILITVSYTENPPSSGRILNFSTPKIVDSFSTVNFNVILENWGKTLWKPFGKISLTGILKQKEEIKLLEQNVLSNSTRQLDIEPFKPKLPIGPFKAKLTFAVNENGPELTTETVFWYFPYKLIVVLITFIILLFVFKKIFPRHSD